MSKSQKSSSKQALATFSFQKNDNTSHKKNKSILKKGRSMIKDADTYSAIDLGK